MTDFKNYLFLILISANVLMTYHCVIAYPYRQKNLLSSSIKLKTKSGDVLFVNKELSSSYNSFNTYINENKLDTYNYFIPQRNYIGLCYLSNFKLPAGLWITENNKEFSRFLIGKIPNDKLLHSLIILNASFPCTELIDSSIFQFEIKGKAELKNQRGSTDTLMFYSLKMK
ncbi:hypothetical protein LBMAG27_03580 [Bacteroidota bacterium]|nr:hypothetical protein LBMAG27_03580 [Bacteroidota bacterium]